MKVFLLISSVLHQQGPALPFSYQEPTPLSPGSFWNLAGKTIGSLLLVLGLIVLFIFFLKRLNLRGPLTGSHSNIVKVISHQTLLPKRSLYLVKVAEKFLVLGVSPSGINLITELEDGWEAELPGENNLSGFSQQLDRFLSKFKGRTSLKRMTSLQSEFQGNLRKIRERIGNLEKLVNSSLQ